MHLFKNAMHFIPYSLDSFYFLYIAKDKKYKMTSFFVDFPLGIKVNTINTVVCDITQ